MELTLSELESAAHIEKLRGLINDALPHVVVGKNPARLYSPAKYVLSGEGKRLRPVVLLLAAEIYGADIEKVCPAALAIEVFHNFTLVHDDIMDHAEARRGRPTIHVKWDTDTAILCGDYLMAVAYDLLAELNTDCLGEVIHVFHGMVARICEGQTLDREFETQASVSVSEYLHMVDCKTGALLDAALELGGLLGGASKPDRQNLCEVGCHVGRAFQIQDDLLDLVAPDARWGKVIGGDLMEGKKTFLLLSTLEIAQGEVYDWFARIVELGGLPANELAEARHRMELLGVPELARQAVSHHTAKAVEHLSLLPGSPARDSLQWLIEQMQARLH